MSTVPLTDRYDLTVPDADLQVHPSGRRAVVGVLTRRRWTAELAL
ncbi:MAG: hypothetical protein NVSMB55_00790 [Mycobacteriales bacterium]